MPRLLKIFTLLALCALTATTAVWAAGFEDTLASIFTRHTVYGVRYLCSDLSGRCHFL